ncbi:hypothetical protein [Cellulomonas cellasea]|uniref:HEAT repeat domain-containing protein n=1 Tax=Cellulomonas cellasea TaxID=43670 RepID=A0A7W4UIK4_9CELL|nr:hypothetical protein [Cellulomonas cellasea]MBB2924841.1 hypothetical protein [Cellulomonas cellasea]
MTDERFLTPRWDVSWDDIDEAVEGLGGVRAAAPDDDGDDDDERVEWRLDGAEVRLFVDSALHVDQIGVTGERRDEVAGVLEQVVPVHRADEVPGMFDEAEGVGDLTRALGVLAALAPADPDPALVEVLRRGLQHDDPDVRHAALVAASVPAWSVLRPDIERLTQDEDADVRTMAPLVLRSLERS